MASSYVFNNVDEDSRDLDSMTVLPGISNYTDKLYYVYPFKNSVSKIRDGTLYDFTLVAIFPGLPDNLEYVDDIESNLFEYLELELDGTRVDLTTPLINRVMINLYEYESKYFSSSIDTESRSANGFEFRVPIVFDLL